VFGAFWWISASGLPLLRTRALLFLGSISYPLYLIHQEVGNVIITQARERGVPVPVDLLLALGCSLVIATLVTYYAEPWIKERSRRILSGKATTHGPNAAYEQP
jgi:peptidoglycan/LPS O-acetylase OafA/YrhL